MLGFLRDSLFRITIGLAQYAPALIVKPLLLNLLTKKLSK